MAIRFFTILICMITAGMLLWSAFQWMYIGFGLNPAISLPLAVLVSMLPYGLLLQEHCSYIDSVDELSNELDEVIAILEVHVHKAEQDKSMEFNNEYR